MPASLYYVLGSPPCRAVLLTAKAIGYELVLKLTDIMKGEHLKPEFIKINPQHCLPTLVDNGLILTESRAILGYLVDKYGNDDSLYPKDTTKRAAVNQRLYFDIGTLYQSFADYFYPVAFRGADFDPDKLKNMEEAFRFFDIFLEGQNWVAGDTLTIADISIIPTVSTAEILGFNVSKYPNISSWYAKAKKEIKGYDEINYKGCIEFRGKFEKCGKSLPKLL